MVDLGNRARLGFSHMNFFQSLYPWERAWTLTERLDRAISDLVELGANAWRPWIHWGVVEPVIAQPLLARREVTDQRVEDYARDESHGWAAYDHLVDACCAAGIELHLVLGGGYHFALPAFEHATSGMKFLPSVVGHEAYLAHLLLHTRAVVRRYRDRVSLWQLENELNGAGETRTFVRWRWGGSWWNWSFLTAILDTLHEAVKTESPAAQVSHNFVTDIRLLPGMHWSRDIRRWRERLDIVGIDAYPDYVLGHWSRGAKVARTTEAAVEVSGGKPVMVLEAGYPTAPAYRGFSEAGQVEYLESAIESSLRCGARGYYYYNLCSPEGQMRWFQGETPFERVEPHWGLVRGDGSCKPGFDAIRRVYGGWRERELSTMR